MPRLLTRPRLITLLAASVFVFALSCRTSSNGALVQVGMPQDETTQVLRKANAKEVQMDMMGETAEEEFHSYELPDGRIVVVSVRKADGRVVKLSLCRDASKPKSLRKWEIVEQIAVE